MVQAIAAQDTTFSYTFLPVSDLGVTTVEHPKTGKMVVDKVIIQGEPMEPSPRFWVSLFSRYGFNSAFFKYFEYQEVFQRISEVEASDRMRVCIERGQNGRGRVLGVSNPGKSLVAFDDLMNLLDRFNAEQVQYADGIVMSRHMPRIGSNRFNVAGDAFRNSFTLFTPIDGYGAPNVYLSLLREVCDNDMIAFSKIFRSSLSLGKNDDDVGPSMTRALDGFNNDEGYATIRSRVESSTKSWASVYETTRLYKLLVKAHSLGHVIDNDAPLAVNTNALLRRGLDGQSEEDGLGSPLIKAFHVMTGDTTRIYGLANLDALSQKRQRTLPVKCTVYDMLNFATEVATHFMVPDGARQIHDFVGSVLSDEFDMEGTKDAYGDFADFHVVQKLEAGVTGTDAVSDD